MHVCHKIFAFIYRSSGSEFIVILSEKGIEWGYSDVGTLILYAGEAGVVDKASYYKDGTFLDKDIEMNLS